MPDLTELFDQLDALKHLLDVRLPLPSHAAGTLRDRLALEWTYHSNAIEGNTLTLEETQAAIKGYTVDGKPPVEHHEAINHAAAIEFVETLVNEQLMLSERDIREIHALVLQGIVPEDAGRYRRENVVISGASTTPPSFLQLQQAMSQLLEVHAQAHTEHVIAHIARLHTRFVEIHPFIDGNGRTGRLVMNLELMKRGYPPAILRVETRQAYYDALDSACVTGNFDAITRLVAEAVHRSLALYQAALSTRQAPQGSPRGLGR